MFDDLSLLQLTAVAEEYVWGQINLDDDQREQLRRTLLNRFAQVEALNKRLPYPPQQPGNAADI
jgi:hypothetical protein